MSDNARMCHRRCFVFWRAKVSSKSTSRFRVNMTPVPIWATPVVDIVQTDSELCRLHQFARLTLSLGVLRVRGCTDISAGLRYGSPDRTAHGRYGPRPIRPTAETGGEIRPRHRPPSQGCLPEHDTWRLCHDTTPTHDGYECCSLTDLMDMYTCMSDNSYQYHTVVLVTIIISRRIDRGMSNWSIPAVRNCGPYRPGRLGHGPYRLDTPVWLEFKNQKQP